MHLFLEKSAAKIKSVGAWAERTGQDFDETWYMGHPDQDQFFLNQAPVEVLPSPSSHLSLQTHASPCNNV